jgi:hypothetical protein
MKNEDPAIEAIREARHQISESVGHDPRKLVEYYRRLQDRHRERVVAQPTILGATEEDAA